MVDNWKRYNQAETDPVNLTLKMYQFAILHLKKVKVLFGQCKFRDGEPHLIKATFLITELALQLPTEEQLQTKFANQTDLKELVAELENTYHASLRELEYISVTRDIRNVDKIITAITNLYEGYNGVRKQAGERV